MDTYILSNLSSIFVFIAILLFYILKIQNAQNKLIIANYEKNLELEELLEDKNSC